MSLTDNVRILETLVKVPQYHVIGNTKDKVIYASTEQGLVSLWSLDPDSGSKLMLTKEPIHTVAKPKPLSTYVFYTKDVSRGKELQRVYVTDSDGKSEKQLGDIAPIRIFAMATDGYSVAFTGATAQDIAVYRITRSEEYEKLASLRSMGFVTDVNDRYVAGFGTMKGDPRSSELFFLDLSTNEFTIFTPKEGSINKSPTLLGSSAVFESNFEGKNRLYSYDPESKEVIKVQFTHKDYEDYDPVEHLDFGFTSDNKLWLIAKKDGSSSLFLDGKKVWLTNGFVSGAAVINSLFYVSHSTLTTPPMIYSVDLKTLDRNVIVNNELPEEIKQRFGPVSFVRYRSFDGIQIPAFIAESRVSEKPGPTVVYVHGGPWSEVFNFWNVLIASLIVSGYHVVAPNFRGSTGYGESFRIMDIGDPGGGDLNDVVLAKEWAVKEGLANRVAVMGYSYGGYMTLLAIGKNPEAWACGVAGASVTDWEEMYNMSDAIFRSFIDILFANRKDLLKERSPISYVDNVNAPLCIIHPQNDTRTPLKPVMRYISRLLELGRTFEVHISPDMGHIVSKVEDITKIVLPAIIFLNRYLKSTSQP